MFSKIAACLVSLLLLSACARENEPAEKPIEVSLKGGSDCLAEFGNRMIDYAHERLSPQQITDTWNCAAKAIGDFQRLTTPDASEGAYTPEGLAHFLERYFIKGKPLGRGLLASVMEIKRVLISGSSDRITPEEIERMKSLLGELRDISLDMREYAGVIFMNRPGATDDDVREASKLVEAAGRRLGRWIQANGQSYTFAQAEQLVDQIHGWVTPSQEGTRVYERFKRALKIVPEAKQILVAGPREGIRSTEWESVFTSVVRGYAGFISTYYSFEDFNSGLLRRGIPLSLERFSELMEEGIRARDGKPIPAEAFEKLFARLEETGWTATGAKPGSMMAFWCWFFHRTLKGASTPGDVGKLQINRLRKFAGDWNLLLDYSEGKKVAQTPDVILFEKVLRQSYPAQWDKQNRMHFAPARTGEWSSEEKRHMVWPFVAMNLLREAYGEQGKEVLTEEQVLTAAGEVLPILQNFGWLLETQNTIGSRLVREANLFTQSGDGDGVLSLGEATRYVAFAASAFQISDIWLKHTKVACGENPSAACVREQALKDPEILANMPRLQAVFSKMPPKSFYKYMRQAEEIVLETIPEESYGTGDLCMVMMLFQYVEVFVQRFDSNLDERIDLPEAKVAYSVYQHILGQLLEPVGLPPEELDAFFTFMMKYGDTPFTMMGGQVAYNHWLWHRNDWVISADRPILMGILNQLSKF